MLTMALKTLTFLIFQRPGGSACHPNMEDFNIEYSLNIEIISQKVHRLSVSSFRKCKYETKHSLFETLSENSSVGVERRKSVFI